MTQHVVTTHDIWLPEDDISRQIAQQTELAFNTESWRHDMSPSLISL